MTTLLSGHLLKLTAVSAAFLSPALVLAQSAPPTPPPAKADTAPAPAAAPVPAPTAADAPEGLPVGPQTEAYLKRLIEALRADDSFKVRLQAAVFLGRSDDDRAFEPLVAALNNDEHYTVRAAAATALANLNDPRAISHVIKRLATDADPFVRDEAQRGLSKFDREEALPYVVATYGSDDPAVRRQAVLYLAEAPSPAAQQVLVRALGDTPEIFQVARDTALNMPPPEGLKFLETALDHRDASVRRGAVVVLHGIATAESAALILKVYERDIEADSVRNETRTSLRELRRFLPIAQFIKDAQESANKHERTKALKLLGVVGGDEAKDVLTTALNDQDVYVRGNAVMAVGELGDTAVVPALEKLESDPSNQRILHLVRHALKQLKKKSPGTN
ncbi:MAG: HEAT repeat domain-containing protein [Deltaproteobacteria bacterium]|nr:HEAT repeat domain-containing protein [Deltaproteobacteria bacterium]